MASSHGSSPVPRGGRDGIYHKDRNTPPPRCRSIRSLPDVCPKEPTVLFPAGEGRGLCDGPSVVAEHDRWTVYSSKVNLPAALNDPRLAKRESDFFTKTWGLDFAETEVMPSFYLPNITREHFGPYLQEMAQRERIHERCKTICPNKDDVEALSSITTNHDKSRAELEQVPKIFMKPEFALDDPATFNSVLPWSHFNSAGGKSSRDVASSKLLQEKLSHYLDVVEVSIARQISLRSEAFFHAMSSQHELQDRLQDTQRAVAVLRGRTAAIDRVMCQGPLRALRTALTRNNCVKLHNKLKLMAAVHQTQPTVQLLLSTSEFVGALELISTTKEVLQQELQGIHSFRHLGSQLCELEKLIDKMMVEDFSMYARSDLNRCLREDEPQVLEKERLECLVFGLLRQRKLDFLDIYGDEMIMAVKAIVSQCVAENVLHMEDIDTEVVTKLADQMRLMTFPQWFELLENVFESFLLFLQRIKATQSVIKNVVLEVLASTQKIRLLEEAGSRPSVQEAPHGPSLLQGEAELAYLTHEGLFISDALNEAQKQQQQQQGGVPDQSSTAGSRIQQSRVEASGYTETSVSREQSYMSGENMMPSDLELNRVINNLQELLFTASDVSHDRCVKVLTARAKDGSLERLSSAEFVCLSQAVEGFVRDTEELCGRRSSSLRGALQSQANRFVHRFHEERKTKLSLLLDNERWKQAEVPAEFQDLVNSIADGRIGLPERKIPGPEDRKPADFLLVNGQKYAVVGTVLLLIRIFLEYCQCVNDIPSIATDMLTRLSDLLKHFNSRSCQLVLGAGALQVVGLKTITTKNLALASRCLQLVVQYIPIIRAHFESKLQPKQFSVLRHFDHITKDYNDHIAEVSAKLVAIMDSLFEKVSLKYEVKAPMPSACFRNVCKQMAKMHEAISELLPEEQMQMLFLKINASFKMHLKRQLARLGVVNDGGPQNGLVVVDVAFYTENMQALKSLDRLDLNMGEIWEQKR
ncbi:vacuolar protein sorting-associated protein 54 isoform X1 [Cottoperca gobio]|uniref:Vacuolar protein sorting-associated protein 54 n=1 Tax=Cottoperca gobio TaxID=56716 RepID=A0A6J2R6N3_COTGO|nr:vacuolar protein sorting-associated protein 54 isoform X1 [Cottoperca gobio]XP_029306477.1 vacuolar protein sorting-associated protein 54 isoform X1 [Cottoperca gobio]XP_029306485.1 vacuolar protein sorting-associated protein 54 isoform X1 [Cottoperca gobio]